MYILKRKFIFNLFLFFLSPCVVEKNGVAPSDAPNLFGHILTKCPNLHVEGVMTIGKFGHDPATGPNPDFIELMKCHQAVCEKFEREPADVSVSMGMSDDFEQAVSTTVTKTKLNEISETNIPDDWFPSKREYIIKFQKYLYLLKKFKHTKRPTNVIVDGAIFNFLKYYFNFFFYNFCRLKWVAQ